MRHIGLPPEYSSDAGKSGDLFWLFSVDNPALEDEVYIYDDVGNRLTAADVSGTWNYNANNELLDFVDVEYEYDANGSMISRTTRISHKQGFET